MGVAWRWDMASFCTDSLLKARSIQEHDLSDVANPRLRDDNRVRYDER